MKERGLTLRGLIGELDALVDTLDLVELGTADRTDIEAEIEAFKREIPHKVDATARVRAQIQAQIKVAEAEALRMCERVELLTRSLARLDAYVLSVLEALPEPKKGEHRAIHGAHTSLVLGKCPPAVHVVDEQAIPTMFTRFIPASSAPDKTAIKKAIDAGVIVPGAELRAGVRLRVL